MLLCNTRQAGNGLMAQSTAYRLTGKVTDAATGNGLHGASVFIDRPNGTLQTDSSGLFSIRLPKGKFPVKISMVGYNTTTFLVDLDTDTQVDIPMVSYENQLEQVVIMSRKEGASIATPSLGVNILSLQSVKRLPAMGGEVDIIRSLQALPGVTAVGESANGINIRGANVDQSIIYFEDMPIVNPTHMLGLFSVLATDAIREFQIYKGGLPARYGGRSAAVLDIKMTNPSTEKFKMVGGVGLVSNRLTMEIPVVKEKLSILTSGRLAHSKYLIKLYNGTFRDGEFDRPLPDNNAGFYDLANKIYYRPNEKHVLSLSNYISNDSYEVDSLFGVQNLVAERTSLQYRHENYALHWNYFITPVAVLKTTATHCDYSTLTRLLDEDKGAELGAGILYRQLKSEFSWLYSERHRLDAGLSALHYTVRPGQLDPKGDASNIVPIHLADERSLELAAFVSEEYSITSRLLVEAGLRYAHYRNLGPAQLSLYLPGEPKSEATIIDTLTIPKGQAESTYGGLEPRLVLRYKLNELSSIKAGYNRNRQFIHLLSNTVTPLPSARWKTSNRYIEPQKSDFFSFGYFRDTRRRFWEFSAELYYRKIDNFLDFVNSADLQLNPAVETQLIAGKSKAYGLELMVSKKKGALTGWINYTWSRALQQIRGEYPEIQQINEGAWFPSYIDKPHTVNCVVDLRSDDHNSLSFTFTYSTGRPFTAPIGVVRNGEGFSPIYLERNNARISDYHRLDIAWTISNPSMRKKRFQTDWILAVYNVYARKNAYSYFFKPVSSGVRPYKLSVFPKPIFSVTCNFKFQ